MSEDIAAVFDERRSVFMSYAHADNESADPKQRWLDRFLQFLKPLVRQQDLTVWSDQDIKIGERWHQRIQSQLETARAVVLLVSPAFLASDYIANNELPVLLKNAADRGVAILPIIISPCLYDETEFKYPDPRKGPDTFTLASIQSANPPSKTLVEMAEGEQNRVLLKVAKQLADLIREDCASTHSGWRYGDRLLFSHEKTVVSETPSTPLATSAAATWEEPLMTSSEREPVKPAEMVLRQWADAGGGSIRVRHIAKKADEADFFSIDFENPPDSYPANATFRFWGAEPLDNSLPAEAINAGARRPLRHRYIDLEARLAGPQPKPIRLSFRVVDRAGTHWSYAKGDSYILETVESTDWKALKKIDLARDAWKWFEADGNPAAPGSKPDFSSILAIVIELGGDGNPARPSIGSGTLHIRNFRLYG